MELVILAIVVIGIIYFAVKHGDKLVDYDIARAERKQADDREAYRRAAQRRLTGRGQWR